MKKAFMRTLVGLFSVAVALAGVDLLLGLVDPFRFTPKNEFPFQKPALYRLSKVKELGYELRAETKVDVAGIEYRINRLGFRDIEHRFLKTDKRVAIVGDSITFGWDLPLEDTYAYQTREKLRSEGRKVEIMAMGITGYNLMQEYHLIKERALRFAPDLIVVQICLNDFEKTLGIRPDPKQQFLLTQYGEIFIPYLFKKTKLSHWLMARSYLFKLLNLKLAPLIGNQNRGSAPRDFYSSGTETAVENLRRTKALLAGTPCRFAAVLFPFRNDDMRQPYLAFYQAILKELEALSVPTLDLNATLNSSMATPEALWIDYLHPSRAGNQRVAEKLADFILSLLEVNTDGRE
ncbi:MAG: SGNH/GDSL hydrolase family protein [Candidatus Aminicenantes bacterium]|nr:SGNH/GDSL hydrolase family protein [Candidatus Aminicenantes bacterium]